MPDLQPQLHPQKTKTPGTHRVRVTPLARAMADSLHIDLAKVKGTGMFGGICKADIDLYQKQHVAKISDDSFVSKEKMEKSPAQEQAKSKALLMRKAIADAMTRANREIPHYYLHNEIELSSFQKQLETLNAERSVLEQILPVSLFAKAIALACKEYPEFNGFWLEDRFQGSDAVHLGVAISQRKGGLIAPAILNVQEKNLETINRELLDLIQRARRGKLRSSEINSATITLTAMGDLGVDTVYGVIYPPQVALVGVGKIKEKPWAEAGMLGIKPLATLTLSADHRASFGVRGALFLRRIEQLVREGNINKGH